MSEEKRKGYIPGDLNNEYNNGKNSRVEQKNTKTVFLVGRLLGKLSEKLIVSPLVKSITGVSHQETMATATQNVDNNVPEARLERQIAAGEKVVGDLSETTSAKGTVAEHFWYWANQKKLGSLKNSLQKSTERPRGIRIALEYMHLMKVNREKHLIDLENQKVQEEYAAHERYVAQKEAELVAAQAAMQAAVKALEDAKMAAEQFKAANAAILGLQTEPTMQMTM